jgi:hypothetical protein
LRHELAGATGNRWQTDEVRVVEGQVFLQVALIFGLIGVLGLVLRWTFRRDTTGRPGRAGRAKARGREPRPPASPPAGPGNRDGSLAESASPEGSAARPSGDREDYGLLAVAAEVANAEEATKVRRVLTAAGIRSTNALAGDGRYRVLVFGDELIKARRVAGGSKGAGGGTAGTSKPPE